MSEKIVDKILENLDRYGFKIVKVVIVYEIVRVAISLALISLLFLILMLLVNSIPYPKIQFPF